MSTISIREIASVPLHTFMVTLTDEDGGVSSHAVTVDTHYADRLGWKDDVDELVRRSFEFLLAREPKEAILREFNLSVIARYFPEYEGEMKEG